MLVLVTNYLSPEFRRNGSAFLRFLTFNTVTKIVSGGSLIRPKLEISYTHFDKILQNISYKAPKQYVLEISYSVTWITNQKCLNLRRKKSLNDCNLNF